MSDDLEKRTKEILDKFYYYVDGDTPHTRLIENLILDQQAEIQALKAKQGSMRDD